MHLSDFIVGHLDDILRSWVDFARAAATSGTSLDDAALGDDARRVLIAVSASLASDFPASPDMLDTLSGAACSYASARVAQGFTLDQMIAEYRWLRSDVIRRWSGEVPDFSREAHEQQVRFNDLIDQALAASTARYAKQLEMARDLFLGVLGHDLRTPLAAIAHSATLLQRSDAPAELREEAVERVSNCARRMDLMIQDLLDFTRSRLGTQLPMKPVPCDLEEISRRALDELTALHPGTPVVLKSSGDLRGTWDCERVTQMLSNLVDNAIRHSSGDASVTVEVRGSERMVEISVHNVGQVIPRAEQKSIFDPLRRGIHPGRPHPPAAGTAGLGLGLYIAEQIAAAHGGEIRLTSTADQGTCFTAALARHTAERRD